MSAPYAYKYSVAGVIAIQVLVGSALFSGTTIAAMGLTVSNYGSERQDKPRASNHETIEVVSEHTEVAVAPGKCEISSGNSCGAESSIDRHGPIQALAVTANIESHAEETTSLLDALRASNGSTWHAALFNLLKHVNTSDVELLKNRLLTESGTQYGPQTVRWGIARSFGVMPGASESTIPLLIDMLANETDLSIRWAAALSLGQLGPLAGNSVEALTAELLNVGRDTEMVASGSSQINKYAENHKVRMRCAVSLVDILGHGAANLFADLQGNSLGGGVNRLVDWQALRTAEGDTFLTTMVQGDPRGVFGAVNGTFFRVYWPNSLSTLTNAKILVSIHGTGGNPELYLDRLREPGAESHQALLVVPYFDEGTWVNFDNLNLGSPGLGYTRSDLRLLEIVDAVSTATGANGDDLYLYGHSRGGQFVQRFIWGHGSRVARAVASGSGNFINLDDPNVRFPFGFASNPFGPDLTSPMVLEYLALPSAFIYCGLDGNTVGRHNYLVRSNGLLDLLDTNQTEEAPVQLLEPDCSHVSGETVGLGVRFLFRPDDFPPHSADYGEDCNCQNYDWHGSDMRITLPELLRVIQIYNIIEVNETYGEFHCDKVNGEDGFAFGAGPQWCRSHDSDYSPQDWRINLSELLRVVQIFNFDHGKYFRCGSMSSDADGICLGDPVGI